MLPSQQQACGVVGLNEMAAGRMSDVVDMGLSCRSSCAQWMDARMRTTATAANDDGDDAFAVSVPCLRRVIPADEIDSSVDNSLCLGDYMASPVAHADGIGLEHPKPSPENFRTVISLSTELYFRTIFEKSS